MTAHVIVEIRIHGGASALFGKQPVGPLAQPPVGVSPAVVSGCSMKPPVPAAEPRRVASGELRVFRQRLKVKS